MLNARGKQNCLPGRATFMTLFVIGIVEDFEPDEGEYQHEPNCPTEESCLNGMAAALSSLIGVSMLGIEAIFFPREVTDLLNVEYNGDPMCDHCTRRLTSVFTQQRSLLWLKLRTLFNIEDMEDVDLNDDVN